MGKQINYWLGYEDFLQIGQAALDCGCVIIKSVSGKLIPFENSQRTGNYSEEGNTVISAGFSSRHDDTKELVRSRLFTISGYYDSNGEYIPRPECITKVYNKLVYTVKKVAPYTELADTYISMKNEDYLQEKEWKHKEYIAPDLLHLKLFHNYKLRV